MFTNNVARLNTSWKLLVNPLWRTTLNTSALSNRFYSETLPISDVKTNGFQLRDYQREAIDVCTKYVTTEDTKRIGVSLATGGGKTVIFAKLIEELSQLYHSQHKKRFRTLILVHRRELAFQALQKIRWFCPNTNVQLEMAKDIADVKSADTIIASITSLSRRLDKYRPDDIDLIIVDEAHHIVANTYMKILNHFGADKPNTDVPVIGFSATFERADKRALSTALDEIIFHKDVMEMIDEKWLCEGRFTNVKISADLSKVTKNRNDFNPTSLSKALNTSETNNVIIKTYLHMKKVHGMKSTLLFGVDKAHVADLNKIFIQRGVKSEYITSDFRPHERDRILHDFKDGKIEVLMNCGILTEGTDIPNIDCILLCRPTCSRPLLVQMIGRGLRLHKGKHHCHIVDFVNASSVGVVSVPTLFGITDFNESMNDMTLSEIESLREAILKKEALELKLGEDQRNFEFEQRRARGKLIEDTLKQEYKNYITDVNVTLLSYDSFRDYYLRKHDTLINKLDNKKFTHSQIDFTKERDYIINSQYPWVQFTKSSWALSLRGCYLRIDRLKEIPNYNLSLYISPAYTSPGSIAWSSKRDIHTGDLTGIISKANHIVESIYDKDGVLGKKVTSPGNHKMNFTKWARWRRLPPTTKQRTFLSKKLYKYHKDNKDNLTNITKRVIDDYLASMTRGSATDLTFAISLASVYSLQSLFRLLNFSPVDKHM